MDILATSVYLRYLELCGEEIPFPSNGYQGYYVIDIASTLIAQHDRNLVHPAAAVMDEIPADVDITRWSRYWQEAFNGVVMRMALLALVLGARE